MPSTRRVAETRSSTLTSACSIVASSSAPTNRAWLKVVLLTYCRSVSLCSNRAFVTTDSPHGAPSPQPGYPTTEAWRLIPHEDHTGSDARAQPADADRRRDTDAGRAAAHQHRHAARPHRHRRRDHRLG